MSISPDIQDISNTSYLIYSNKEQIQFTYVIKDSEVFLNDYLFCQARLRMKELPEFEEWVTTLICTDGHLYGHQTQQCPEFTNEYAGSIPATSTTLPSGIFRN